MALKPKPYPKSLGACADLLFLKRQERLAADKVAAGLKSEEEALKTHIIDNLEKGSAGAVGKTHKVIVGTDWKPVVSDWPAFYAYVKKNNAFDMLQKRVGEAAIVARLEDGKKVAGVEKFTYVTISLTKV